MHERGCAAMILRRRGMAMVEKVVSQACLCACGFCGLSSSLSSGFVVISIRWHEHGLINRSGRQD